MIEDDFYATIKLKTGEEIFAKVLPSEEGDNVVVILTNPIVVSEIKARGKSIGYKIEPWLKTTKEDMLLINLNDVLTMCESSDIEMIVMYQSYVRQISKEKRNEPKINRRMGYISSVNDAKEILEKLYKNS